MFVIQIVLAASKIQETIYEKTQGVQDWIAVPAGSRQHCWLRGAVRPYLRQRPCNWCALMSPHRLLNCPSLPTIRYRDVDEAVKAANDSPNSLGVSVWSRDMDHANHVAGQMECGAAWINKHGAIQPNAPFGGTKSSGFGVEFAEESLREYTSQQLLFS